MTSPGATAPPGIAWSWPHLGLGVAYGVPALLVGLGDPSRGAVLAVGMLPAAALGLRGSRRERVAVVPVGALAGASLLLGSLVGGTPWLAALVLLVVATAVAAATSRPGSRIAPVALGLGVPMMGAGLSVEPADAAALALLLVAGSVYAWLVSLAWPERRRPVAPARERPVPSRAAAVAYGLQIGVAGALCALLAFGAGLDHPGWAATAALLVSRPRWAALRDRGVGRSVSVVAGALVACLLAGAPDLVVAVAVCVAVACGTATSGSRWYVLPFFSTFLVLTLLLGGEPSGGAHWFAERVGETLLGVAVAMGAALLAPRVLAR
jgi:hypothetical protein